MAGEARECSEIITTPSQPAVACARRVRRDRREVALVNEMTRKRRKRKRYPHKPAKLRPPQPPGLLNVKYQRERRHWRQVDLARHSGVKLATILSIEQGKTIDPKLSTLIKLARAFGVPLGVLVGIEEPTEV